jgi:hypothetical protein
LNLKDIIRWYYFYIEYNKYWYIVAIEKILKSTAISIKIINNYGWRENFEKNHKRRGIILKIEYEEAKNLIKKIVG